MKKIGWIVLIIIVVIALGAYFYWQSTTPAEPAAQTAANTSANSTPVAMATYTCNKGHTITAAYFNGPAATTTPAAGQPPVPNGTVEVSLDGGATTTLAQTLSADGARYSNGNPQVAQGQPGAETFVFWNKGNTALIMRNNAMDLTYTNCSTTAQ